MFQKFLQSMRQTPILEFNVGKHSAKFTGVPALIAGGAIGVGVGKAVKAVVERRDS